MAPPSSPPPPPPQRGGRLLLVLHGKAAGDPGVRAAVAATTTTAVGVDVRPTYSAGDARSIVLTELAAAAAGARPPVATVVAGGGDGTLCEVIQAVLEFEKRQQHHQQKEEAEPIHLPSLTMLLAGTANDLGSACGVSADPAEALRLAADPSRARPVDVAFCNGVPFVNVATAGPISAVSSAGMSESLKRLLGPLSVPLAGLVQVLTPARRHSLRPQAVTLIFPTGRGVAEPPLPGEKVQAKKGGADAEAEAEAVAATAASAVAGAAAGAAASGAAETGAEAEAEAVAGPPEGGGGGGESTGSGVVMLPPPPGASGAAAAGAGGEKVMAVKGNLVALAVGQARQMGRLVNVCPEALLDDGLIDATVLFAPSLGAAAADLARDALSAVVAAAGKQEQEQEQQQQGESPPPPVPLAGLCTLRVPWLHVVLEEEEGRGVLGSRPASFGAASDAATAAGAVAATPVVAAAAASSSTEAPPAPLLMANLDGEPLVQARALRFSVLPRAVKLHLPDDRLLVAGLPEAVAEAKDEKDGGGKGDDNNDKASRRREVAVDFGGGGGGAGTDAGRRLARPLARLRGGRPSSRAELLRALLRAKQPPGRMARALPVILARLRIALLALALVALGVLVGVRWAGAASAAAAHR